MITDEYELPGECPHCGYSLADDEEKIIKKEVEEETVQLKIIIERDEPTRCPHCGSIIPEGESEVFLPFREEIKERNTLSYKEWLKRL